eukprot:Gb_02299 [translate_table: standard]
MGGQEELAVPAPAPEELNPDEFSLKTRIFVGGLGISVTPSDVERTFSSLGRVLGVEIVRTNGRSFAYMDFEPQSDKALSKLFSSYNGCMWKGGRLKLEKAKEHYLVRLHREWATDAAQAATAEVDVNEPSKLPAKRATMMPETSGLRIFFPKLKKVKVLPSRGTGKHKYSFQRVESLSLSQLPVCGCEEHKRHPEIDESNQVVSNVHNGLLETGGICQKELDIMKKVMEKLIMKEDHIQAATDRSKTPQPVHAQRYEKRGPSKTRVERQDMDDIEGTKDSDDEVISVDEISMTKKVMEHLVEEKGLNNIETFGRESDLVVKDSSNEAHSLKESSEMLVGKRSLGSVSKKAIDWEATPGEIGCKSQTRISPQNTGSFPMEVNAEGGTGSIEHEERKRLKVEDGICSSVQHEEIEVISNINIGLETKGSIDSTLHNSGKIPRVQDSSHSWVQKASWKELVGETGRISFSLSSVFGGVSSPNIVDSKEIKTHEAVENYSLEHTIKDPKGNLSVRCGKNRGQEERCQGSNDKGSNSFLTREVMEKLCSELQEKSAPLGGKKDTKDVAEGEEGSKEGSAEQGHDKKNSVQLDPNLHLSQSETAAADVCPFMRSANAEEEWLKSKAVAQGYAKARRRTALKSLKRLGTAPIGRC